MRDVYKYEGTIACSANLCREITLFDITEDNKPPVAIRVSCNGLADYLSARSWDDAEERYIKQVWIYDRNLVLWAVVIPGNRAMVPAKVIACRNPELLDEEIVIYGPKELLNDPHPASMDDTEYHLWLDFQSTYKLRPRN